MKKRLMSRFIHQYLKTGSPKKRAAYGERMKGERLLSQNLGILWKNAGYSSYKVYLSLYKDYFSPLVYFTNRTRLDKGACIPGRKYYYKVVGLNVSADQAKEGAFYHESVPVKTGRFLTEKDTIRFVNIDGSGALPQNTRDLGGWKAMNGTRVNYGLLYRGPYFYGMTHAGMDMMRDYLGIRTEMELRVETDRPDRNRENLHESPLGRKVKYLECPIGAYSYNLPEWKRKKEEGTYEDRAYFPETKSSLSRAFHALANAENYPIYFHCTAGADRSATMAFLILALLGVSIEDICLDFEMTSFSGVSSTHFRGPLVNGVRVYGVSQDDRYNYVALGEFYQNLMKWYGGEGKTLAEAVENYLVGFIGVPPEEISSLRDILLRQKTLLTD